MLQPVLKSVHFFVIFFKTLSSIFLPGYNPIPQFGAMCRQSQRDGGLDNGHEESRQSRILRGTCHFFMHSEVVNSGQG